MGGDGDGVSRLQTWFNSPNILTKVLQEGH